MLQPLSIDSRHLRIWHAMTPLDIRKNHGHCGLKLPCILLICWICDYTRASNICMMENHINCLIMATEGIENMFQSLESSIDTG